jgi:hypothetical protein
MLFQPLIDAPFNEVLSGFYLLLYDWYNYSNFYLFAIKESQICLLFFIVSLESIKAWLEKYCSFYSLVKDFSVKAFTTALHCWPSVIGYALRA